ncbi:sodium-dependent neutral amino acid transporter B(0)AT3 isoform X1 [Hydra vulgaris]|uniref:sodium-dependent neutral amino acid transporter B(0)AT3 isoform X1 n=1 Tax=Hydra vulgaris TaxID=6087 RepID=UPI001F5F0B20|nr:sodium-dependent neutral amino acid transporter B(0)AT3 isoform X1 [Hydra vulgaris]
MAEENVKVLSLNNGCGDGKVIFGEEYEKVPLKDEIVEVDVKIAPHEKREAWGHKAEFILASIGLAVGLGNVWRFPYLCQKNGGGAFLIPYFIMMVIEGIPLFYLEFAVGQRFRRSAVGCWKKIHPALTGIGISCIVVSCLLCIYYVAILAWCFYYLFASLTSKLPWQLENCPQYLEYSNISALCAVNKTLNDMCLLKERFPDCCVHDPQLYYFYRKALNISPSITDLGDGIQWKLFGCLVLSWIIAYACIVKGVKSSGKAVYFTATFPYVVLIILFFVGVTLEGASIGIKTLFTPDFSKLKDPTIWMDAATQMFYTLSVGFGAHISFASYMPIKNNCVRDALTIVILDCGTSVFAGIVVFSILGHREFTLGAPANKIGGGPGLAFITFCDAFLQMPASPVWSVLFFFMLILLGIDSEFGTLEGAIAPFYDMKWVKMRKEIFTGIVAFCMLLCGISLVSSSGFYAFQIFDDYAVSLGLLFIAFFQTISISWVYGNDKFADDIEYMTGKRPYFFWMICWKYISPLAIFIIFVSNCHQLVSNSLKYSAYVGCAQQEHDISPLGKGVNGSIAQFEYPPWALFIIFIFILSSLVPIFFFIIKDIIEHPSLWLKNIRKKLTNIKEYHPDPYRVDPSRRRTNEEVEATIINESKFDD